MHLLKIVSSQSKQWKRLGNLYKASQSQTRELRIYPAVCAQNVQPNRQHTATLSSPANGSADAMFESSRAPLAKLDTTFSNSHEAYKSKTTGELLRALFVFKLTSIPALVRHNMQIMKLMRRVLGKRLFVALMNRTFYGQFVAGADVNEIKPLLQRNLQSGVKSILDYSVEEDMPESEATAKEKGSCENTDSQSTIAQSAETSEKYHYHAEFADRRKTVTSARTYFYDSESQCDRNMWTFMKCVDTVAETTDTTGLAAIKLTALGRPQFLLQMSRVLTLMHETFYKLTSEETNILLKRINENSLCDNLQHLGVPISRDDTKYWFTWMDKSGSGEVDLYSWSNLLHQDAPRNSLFTVPNLQTGKLEQLYQKLTPTEELEMMNMFRRINTIVEHASERGVPLMIDAEQSYFQPAINRLTMEMMRKFNKEGAVVYNTYQCYLKQAYDNFITDLDLSRREGFCFSAKIVRGAYMDQERARAASVGYEDPINPTYEATSSMYERVIERAIKESMERPRGQVSFVAATHNEDSIRFIVNKLEDLGIQKEDQVVCFAQLLGMCDHISFPLGQSGYSVYKYVPYGPVEEVLPYLSRRAAENNGILTKVRKEKRMLKEEIKRRVLRRPAKVSAVEE